MMVDKRCVVLCCRFVEQEVERVKVLFDQKEGRLRSERDAAQRQLQHLQAAQEDWEAQGAELKAQLAAAKEQLEHQRQTAAQAVKRAAAAEAAATGAEADASAQAARVAEVEKEMGQLLAVVEAQKAASAVKMRQLASLLQDM
jgi:leucine-rich repeat/coiled-coil domain-containing protein 1